MPEAPPGSEAAVDFASGASLPCASVAAELAVRPPTEVHT